MLRCLYLTEWYPHRYDAMPGLFVRKHAAAAVRAGADVCVLYLHRDRSVTKTEVAIQQTDGVKEIYCYYRCSYLSALLRGWQAVRQHWGIPHVCQLNVLTKNALLPLWLRLTRHVPYIVVEHWSGYLPENGAFKGNSRAHKTLARLAVRYAEAVLPVSQALEKAMIANGLTHSNYMRIHNVVDDFFYSVSPQPQTLKRILHVSCFEDRSKNVKGLLRATRTLTRERKDFQLVLVGTGVDYNEIREYAAGLHFPENVLLWTGELTPQQVAAEMSKADCFVLFSNYENAPVVLSESLATGLPVIATRAGGIPEMINNSNGVLVNPGDETQLTKAMSLMLDSSKQYDRQTIRENAQVYSAAIVGKKLYNVYKQSCTDFSEHTV